MSLSSQQIYLVAESVVVICHKKKNIDLNNITPKQLEEICNLAIERVIEVFKTNDFRAIPHAIAATSGLMVSSVTNLGRLEVGPRPIL